MTTQATGTERVTLVDLLDQLVLPPEPAPISLVPQTAGWLVLAGLLICGAVTATVILLRKHRANAYRREALVALSAAGKDPALVARIVRRTALAAFPRTEVAGLLGEEWLAFLERSSGQAGFRDGPGRFLATAPYQAETTAPDEGIELARLWIKTHSTGKAP